MTPNTADPIAQALVFLEGAWALARDTAWVKQTQALPIDRLPDLGEDAAIARSAKAKALLDAFAGCEASVLPHELMLTVEVARTNLQRIAREGEWYWVVFDPLGGGFFALFAPTAYGGGFLLKLVSGMLADQKLHTSGDLDRYLGLVEDYARMIGQMLARTEGQAERGIYIPRPQLDQSIELVRRLTQSTAATLLPDASRLTLVGGDQARERIAARIEQSATPALERFAAFLNSPEYRDSAPESVGISQYAGGREIYAELVRQHTNLDLSPEQVHERGIARIAAVRAKMTSLLGEIGFAGSPQDYLTSLEKDLAWRADAASLGAFFQRYIDRIGPKIDDYFRFKPRAPHGVAALPEALSGSMTFGYYDAPTPDRDSGLYIYNAQNLSQNALPNVAALNYHELVPGHHFHLATQQENQALHPLRTTAFINAFNEGWAEYAATLAGEMGMYEEPAEQFGRLMMDSFLTTRLVVDTGMNALGWSLEQARDYMREHAFQPETEICSESVRYSCDIPGQALAYKLGEDFLIEVRERMREARGASFDIRDFHDAVLRPGALPLPLVERNVLHQAAA